MRLSSFSEVLVQEKRVEKSGCHPSQGFWYKKGRKKDEAVILRRGSGARKEG